MNALEDIAAERQRQIEAEGWTPAHDDRHEPGELAAAAACYAWAAADPDTFLTRVPEAWPWAADWWKPSEQDHRRDLVKAGALILAEIERIDRSTQGADNVK